MLVRSLGQEVPLEEGMAADSSILAWSQHPLPLPPCPPEPGTEESTELGESLGIVQEDG